jgi:hypothetical protein
MDKNTSSPNKNKIEQKPKPKTVEIPIDVVMKMLNDPINETQYDTFLRYTSKSD